MKELIPKSNLQRAYLMDFTEVMSIVASFLQKEDLEALKLTKAAKQFNEQFSELEKGLVQTRKTGVTQSIVESDHVRDNLFVGFYSVLKGMTHHPDKSVAQKAEAVMIVVQKYDKNIAYLPQRDETAVLSNLVDDLKSDEYKEQVNTLHLTPWVVAIEEANNEFEKLYTERTEKGAEFVVGLAKEQREKVQDAFTYLCQTINAYALIEGEDNYKALANKINEEVSNVKQLVKTRKTKKENND